MEGLENSTMGSRRKELIAPCKGCLVRTPGCHDRCPSYQAWCLVNEARKKRLRFESDCRHYDREARRRKFDRK